MLEIFALCSCACLACLWCAIALELTKDRNTRKKLDEIFGTNCTQCTKDHGPINTISCSNNHVSRKTSNKDTRTICPIKRRKHKIQEKKECTNRMDIKRKVRKKLNNSHRGNRRLVKPNFLNSVSFPYLHSNNGYAINEHAMSGMPCSPCKICCHVRNGCQCKKNIENLPAYNLNIHNSSCPNLTYQRQQCNNGSPVRLSYYSLAFDPCQRQPPAVSNNIPTAISNIPYVSNIPKVFKDNVLNIPNIPNIANIPNVPNIWKDCTKQKPTFRRKRYFPRKLRGRRN
ncbi:uncharacterized protein V1477_015740 [Vespula maculifrons]|uniref:Uncharacterized protein n=1 Tax=Vespula maculifrons TaxID=7453 RepID=A0ABD2BB63_VESMC